jgi:hypothetical protein
MTQADAKKQTILVHASAAERGYVQWVGDEGVGEHGNAILQEIRGIFSDHYHSCRLKPRCPAATVASTDQGAESNL